MPHSLTSTETLELLDQHTAAIRDLEARIARDAWEIGLRLIDIQDRELWQARHGSFTAYLQHEAEVSERRGWRYMRIARHFNAEMAERFGVTWLDAALSWMSATSASERPGDLLAAQIRIRGPSGRFAQVAMIEASAAQVQEATALLKDARRAGQQVSAELDERLDALREVMPTRSRAGDRVRARRDEDGEVLLSFIEVPMSGIREFVQALEAHVLEGA